MDNSTLEAIASAKKATEGKILAAGALKIMELLMHRPPKGSALAARQSRRRITNNGDGCQAPPSTVVKAVKGVYLGTGKRVPPSVTWYRPRDVVEWCLSKLSIYVKGCVEMIIRVEKRIGIEPGVDGAEGYINGAIELRGLVDEMVARGSTVAIQPGAQALVEIDIWSPPPVLDTDPPSVRITGGVGETLLEAIEDVDREAEE